MPYTLSVDKNKKISEFKFYGESVYTEHVEARNKVLQLYNDQDISKFIINMRDMVLHESVSVLNFYNFSSTWFIDDLKEDHFFAIITPLDITSRGYINYAVLIAQERALNFKLFDDINSAMNWLDET